MIQRVLSASVTINEKVVSKIGKGLLVYVGLGRNDTKEICQEMANKMLNVRLWADKENKQWKTNVMNNGFDILFGRLFLCFVPFYSLIRPPIHIYYIYCVCVCIDLCLCIYTVYSE